MAIDFLSEAMSQCQVSRLRVSVAPFSEVQVDQMHGCAKNNKYDMVSRMQEIKRRKHAEVNVHQDERKRELQKYLAEETLPADSDPIAYWSANMYRFPTLAHLAKDYMAIPCTSADIEREFSYGRLIQRHTRGSMSPETMKELMLLHCWLSDPST